MMPTECKEEKTGYNKPAGHYFVDGKCCYCGKIEPSHHRYFTNRKSAADKKERARMVDGHIFVGSKCKYCHRLRIDPRYKKQYGIKTADIIMAGLGAIIS